MKRRIAMVLLVLMTVLFAACGEKKEEISDAGEKAQMGEVLLEEEKLPEKKQEELEEKKASMENQNNQEESEKQENAFFLELLLTKKYEEEWDENFNTMCSASWQELILSKEEAENYPELAKQLLKEKEESEKYYLEALKDFLPQAKEAYSFDPETFYPFFSESMYTVQRADHRILSIREDFNEYTGGVHGMYGAIGINYDPVTGEELLITDIISDISTLPVLLAEKIKEKYADEYETYENLQEYLEEEYTGEDYNWIMSYEGITFYFLPYEVASYSEGMLRATLWFDEIEDLIEEEYMEKPEDGYMIPMPLGYEVDIDLDSSDENKDRVAVSSFYQTEEDREYGIQWLSVMKNDFYHEEGDSYGYSFTPYLVRGKDEEKSFIYVEGIAENDYRTLSVYDLKDENISFVTSIEGTGFPGYWREDAGGYYYKVLLDRGSLELGTRIHLLGTFTGRKTYRVNAETGIPETEMEYYRIDEGKEPLVSKIPLEVLLLTVGKEERLPAGTKFYFLRTDGESYVDMRLEDGRECRIEVEYAEWEYLINGVSEWECFEELFYAG